MIITYYIISCCLIFILVFLYRSYLLRNEDNYEHEFAGCVIIGVIIMSIFWPIFLLGFMLVEGFDLLSKIKLPSTFGIHKFLQKHLWKTR